MTDYPGAGQQPGQWPGPQGQPPQGPQNPQGPQWPPAGQPGPGQPGPGQYGPPPGGFPPPGPGGPGGPFPPGPGGPFPPGPGGFGPGGPYGPPPGGRSKTPWIIGGVAVVAVAAIAVALVLMMGGSKSSSGAKGALDKLLNAAKTRDLKSAQNLTCPPLSTQFLTSPLATVTKWDIGKGDENGDSATVPFTATAANGEKSYTASAQKQKGSWKICNVQEGGGGGGGDAAAAQQTVQRLLQAGKDRDLDTAKSLTCEPLHSEIESVPAIESFQVGTGTVSGSSGTVPFTVTSEGTTYNEVAQVQKTDTWKVCDFHRVGGSSDSNGPGPTDSGLPSIPSMPSMPTDLPSFPTGGGTGSFCVTPNGSTPICIPQ